jgi:hypothetical protein
MIGVFTGPSRKMNARKTDPDNTGKLYMWKTFAVYGSVGLEMGLAVALGYYLGFWANEYWFDGEQGLLEAAGLVAGFGAAAKALIRVARRAKRDLAGDSEESE